MNESMTTEQKIAYIHGETDYYQNNQQGYYMVKKDLGKKYLTWYRKGIFDSMNKVEDKA